jgi:hypothetical protein
MLKMLGKFWGDAMTLVVLPSGLVALTPLGTLVLVCLASCSESLG